MRRRRALRGSRRAGDSGDAGRGGAPCGSAARPRGHGLGCLRDRRLHRGWLRERARGSLGAGRAEAARGLRHALDGLGVVLNEPCQLLQERSFLRDERVHGRSVRGAARDRGSRRAPRRARRRGDPGRLGARPGMISSACRATSPRSGEPTTARRSSPQALRSRSRAREVLREPVEEFVDLAHLVAAEARDRNSFCWMSIGVSRQRRGEPRRRSPASFFLPMTPPGLSRAPVCSTKMMMNTTMTERSNIPAGGRIRRSGRSTGSVTSYISSYAERSGPVAGGRHPKIFTQLRMTRTSRISQTTVRATQISRVIGTKRQQQAAARAAPEPRARQNWL